MKAMVALVAVYVFLCLIVIGSLSGCASGAPDMSVATAKAIVQVAGKE